MNETKETESNSNYTLSTSNFWIGLCVVWINVILFSLIFLIWKHILH